jgi:FeS assembly protein IscX
MGLTWTDHLEIGHALAKMYPDEDPWTMPFSRLRELVHTIPDFEGTPDEEIEDYEFEGIQSAWGWSRE